MAGRRLLDVAALFNASREVLRKHVALRSNQLEVYHRTSTLARAVRHQTERVTETVKAASILASRLNEEAPTWNVDDIGQKEQKHPIPSQRSTKGPVSTSRDGSIDKDQFNDKSVDNSALGRPPTDDLNIYQHTSDQDPLPDSTIPPREPGLGDKKYEYKGTLRNTGPESSTRGYAFASGQPQDIISDRSTSQNNLKAEQHPSDARIPSVSAGSPNEPTLNPLMVGRDEDSFIQPSQDSSEVMSSLPVVKLPIHTSDVQAEASSLATGKLNSDSFYSAKEPRAIPSVQAISGQDSVPEGINTDVFHSKRISKLLDRNGPNGTNGRQSDRDFELRGAVDAPVDETSLSIGKDQDTFNVRSSKNDVATVGDTSSRIAYSTDNGARTQDLLSSFKDQSTSLHSQTMKPYELRESKVPSTRISRIWNYGGLAFGMFGGAISESIRRVGRGGGGGSYMLSEGNMERLVTKLSRMRGAALKLGQLISFQDSKMLPGPIREVLQRVQDRADYMPPSQRDKVLTANLGPDWRDLFSSFEEKPLAAASIGQVHSAILKSTGSRVAVKVQYPGVADSIDSDLSNLGILLTASRLLPKGLFLDKTIANARIELAWECDYVREAECARRFERLLSDEDVFVVPKIYAEASGKQVLTMEFMNGVGVTKVQSFSQEQRDWIGTQILRLCLREITEFKFMQTDPNWTNFLYNSETNKLELLDFGASREYPEEFISRYTKLLGAASRSDRRTVEELSIELGYLTGHESAAMLNAHIASVLTLAEPFLETSPEVYDFRDQTITDRVKEQIPLMIRERLAPPPEETYSLHRKLSGAFLLCARLGSRVKCRGLFQTSMSKAGLS